MIAQVVLDLPIDGPFDYLIPENLTGQISVGRRVKVSFGPRPQIGFVVGILKESPIAKLKTVISLVDNAPAFTQVDLDFAHQFCAYYGCSLGEALFVILRNKEGQPITIQKDRLPGITYHHCFPDGYVKQIEKIIDGYHGSQSFKQGEKRFLILVPDAFRGQRLIQEFKGMGAVNIGMRSSVFESDGQFDCVIMIDEENSSYKQEQTPMYETRHVLMMRSHLLGFDIAFIGVSPSIEMMALINESKVRWIEGANSKSIRTKVVDLTNYKFVPGLISPPLRDALENALKSGKKCLLVLNRKGSYRITRCVGCAEILKCKHCDSPLIYSRSEAKYLCRHCTFTAPSDTICPQCRQSNWKSIGIGVEQLQTELKKQFFNARIQSFERHREIAGELRKPLSEFDILIATSAVLRFQGSLKVQLAAFIDFDAEINRLDMRSAFNAFSLAIHISSMAIDPIFIQTRHINHYVLQHLSHGNIKDYYDEELKLRKEFGFSPFKHWIKINWRGKFEKPTQEAAQQVYQELISLNSEHIHITPPLIDSIGRKRDQYRFNVMVQTNHVPSTITQIKSILKKVKRPSRVILTFNIDP